MVTFRFASSKVGVFLSRVFGPARLILLSVFVVVLLSCMVVIWMTRGAMANFSFLSQNGSAGGTIGAQKTLVDLSPWQTAQALAPLAVSAEETDFARDAERLAGHEVDQAFAAAIRQANLRAEHRALTGDALALSQKVDQLRQAVKDDQTQVNSLTSAATSSHGSGNASEQATASNGGAVNGAAGNDGTGNDQLDLAKEQLGLDTDELNEAQMELDRASGDQRPQLKSELAAHEAAMKKYESESNGPAELAVISAKRHSTLAGRLEGWFGQRSRHQLILQALEHARADTIALTAEHTALEAKNSAARPAAPIDAGRKSTNLVRLQEERAEKQLLGIYEDRIQTEQQLAIVYGKWAAQVVLQHQILMHLILQSLALVVVILICMLLADVLVRWLTASTKRDHRQMLTLRSVFELAVQVVGWLLILLVIFGKPQQTATILGLATAGITIVMQDFILAFFGWFFLMGKNGVHVGDWVEINGVGGEVAEIGLFTTLLLETGTLADKGLPTGRQISFLNSFAIRGQYFNFSTSGQWMWDEIAVTMPDTVDSVKMVESIQKAAVEETQKDANVAAEEWKQSSLVESLSAFTAAPVVSMVPAGGGTDVHVRYVTRASTRFEVRNRLYRRVIDLMHGGNGGVHAAPVPGPAQDKDARHTQGQAA
jgi:small-conductance mechanosensitive channel